MSNVVQIENPGSSSHVVYLNSKQELRVKINSTDPSSIRSKTHGLLATYYNTHHVITADYRETIINQNRSNDYAKGFFNHNVCLLGNLAIDDNGKESNIVIYGYERGSKDTLTVVNPKHNRVRIKPYNIIEVVLYNVPHHGCQWDWDWINNGYSNIYLEELDSTYLAMDGSSIIYPIPKTDLYCFCPQHVRDLFRLEYHYWFRVDQNLMDYISYSTQDKINLGTLYFQNKKDKDVDYSLEVTVDLRKTDKTIEKFNRVLNLPMNKERVKVDPKHIGYALSTRPVSESLNNDSVLPIAKKNNTPTYKHNVHLSSVPELYDGDGAEDYVGFGGSTWNNDQWKNSNHKNYATTQKNEPVKPTHYEVSITKMDSKDLEEGCAIISCLWAVDEEKEKEKGDKKKATRETEQEKTQTELTTTGYQVKNPYGAIEVP